MSIYLMQIDCTRGTRRALGPEHRRRNVKRWGGGWGRVSKQVDDRLGARICTRIVLYIPQPAGCGADTVMLGT